ncbi:extracellular solute-binding protein [Almyronema epifaneia]|uniref:Extracellular solute-binding protein n=1 Tax=Almyronema epifaneia S1 TaxID=2991925 RepID=A0ABW6IJB2_9CYAN
MKRRSLLVATAALATNALLSACSQTDTDALKIELLANSFPPQLLRVFRQELLTTQSCEFDSQEQMSELYAQLQRWVKVSAEPSSRWPIRSPIRRSTTPTPADLVTLGDYWLTSAIQQALIRPFSAAQVQSWPELSPRWSELVKRDRQGYLAPAGEVWGVPYRWGSLALVYRDRPFESLGWQPQTWQDLWRPELRGKISLPNHPRIVIGLVLKQLAQSANSSNFAAFLPQLTASLQSLHRQVKFYSSNHALQALVSNDTWLAVGWTTDVLPVMQQYRQLRAAIPPSGTLLTADVWVQPAGAIAETGSDVSPLSDLGQQWLAFCWRADVATQLSLSTYGASPRFATRSDASLPPALRNHPLLLPGADIFAKSEFLQPLPTDSEQAYAQLWAEIRQSS